MRKTRENVTNIPSGFYDSGLTAQGRKGKQKRYPMDYYTGKSIEESPEVVAPGFPGDFYRSDRD